MKFFAWGIGFGFGYAAWRNLGAVSDPQREAAAFVAGMFVVAVVAAFLLRRRPSSATAVSVARAEAVAAGGSSQVALVFPGVTGAVGAGAGLEQLDALPWSDGTARPSVEDEVLAELVAESDEHGGLDGTDGGSAPALPRPDGQTAHAPRTA